MEIPYPEQSATNNRCATIEVDEEIEGEVTGTKNYRFSRIGEPVPIKSEPDSGFDPECIPSQPLAISERFRLLFVAHPDGFCVARTKEVIAVAEEFKNKNTGRSVQELSFVYLSIGKVSILALSADDSVLAATVGRDVHFFAVSALLHKEKKPSFSVSLDGSSYIKDMRWSRRFEKVYVLLSTDGKLYHGSGQAPFNYMLDNVDCVDWSVKGNFVAVARKNVLSILSSQFKEKLRLSLPFKSVLGDSDVNQVIKAQKHRKKIESPGPRRISREILDIHDYKKGTEYIFIATQCLVKSGVKNLLPCMFIDLWEKGRIHLLGGWKGGLKASLFNCLSYE